MRHVRQERSRSATTPVPGFTAPSLGREPGCCTMVWMTGVQGGAVRRHEYTPSWRSSGSTSLDPSSQGMIVRSARRPGCHRQKWPSARPPLACSAQPRRILSERNGGANTKPTYVSPPGNGRAPRSKEHSTPSADDREPHDRRHTHRTRHSAACGPADGIPQRAQELSPVGELGASSERLTAGGLHEGYVWVVAEAAEA